MSKRTQVHKLSGRRISLSQFHCRPLWKTLQNLVTPVCCPTAQLVHLCFLNWKPSIKPRWVAPLILIGVFLIFYDIFPLETPASQIGFKDCLCPHICTFAANSCRFLSCKTFSSSCFSGLATRFQLTPTVNMRLCILLLLLTYFPLLFVLPNISCLWTCLSLTVILSKLSAQYIII